MGKLIVLILIGCIIGILGSLPLWAVANLFFLVFHLPYHLTLLQAIVICAVVNVLRNLLFKNKEG